MAPVTWEKFFKPLKKNPVFVAGFSAVTGFANAKLLLTYGVNIILLEENFDASKKKLLHKLLRDVYVVGKSKQKKNPLGTSCPMVYSHFNTIAKAKKLTAKHLILSPGLPRNHTGIKTLQKNGIKIWSDFDFFYPLFQDKKIVALSGTNGKTTVALLITFLLQAAINKSSSQKAIAVGNVGTPIATLLFSTLAENSTKKRKKTGAPQTPSTYAAINILVFELSSYMLEKVRRFKANVSLLTNFSKDHLDRYKTAHAYFLAKTNIIKATLPNGFFILNTNDPIIASFTPLHKKLAKTKLKVIACSSQHNKGSTSAALKKTMKRHGVNISSRYAVHYASKQTNSSVKSSTNNNMNFHIKNSNEKIAIVEDKREASGIFLPIDNVLLGLAALLACVQLPANAHAILKSTIEPSLILKKGLQQLHNFIPPPHRMQVVPPPTLNKTQKKNSPLLKQKLLQHSIIINDSKSTTPESVDMALSFFIKNITNKQNEYDVINKKTNTKVTLIVGGKNKGLNFACLQKYLPHLQGIVCYGAAGKEIYNQLHSALPTNTAAHLKKVKVCSAFSIAFKKATRLCEDALINGQPFVLLLSPGCASFDQFSNFEERGKKFMQLSRTWFIKLFND